MILSLEGYAHCEFLFRGIIFDIMVFELLGFFVFYIEEHLVFVLIVLIFHP